MAQRPTAPRGRNPEQTGQAAWMATEKVVRRVSRRPARNPRADRTPHRNRTMKTSPLAPLTRALFPASPSTQNAELFTLTYGAIVRQVLHDYEDCVEDVNKKLDSMGFEMGCRLVEDFLAKTSTARCGDFKETAEVVAKVGLRLFLGIGTRVGEWNPEGTECVITLDTNPLADFVELPEKYRDLSYSQMLCGVIRGALEMVSVRVTCEWARDALRGGDEYALRLRFVEYITHEMPEFDD